MVIVASVKIDNDDDKRAKMTVSHDNLQVVEADIFSADSLKQHLGGQEAVISCLGFPPQKPKVT